MSFDFDAAVQAPFRMQPGLRRLAPGALQLTPASPQGRHVTEKLAVLRDHPQRALAARPGFDAGPALAALSAQAAAEHPGAWQQQPGHFSALQLGWSLQGDEPRPHAHALAAVGDCLRALPAAWRLPALLALAFEEDMAIVDGNDGSIPWMAVALPSHWAPEDKVGRHFAQVHAPVADNQLLVAAGEHLMRLVCGAQRWERFVWNITGHAGLNAHPDAVAKPRWPAVTDAAGAACWRTERQSFVPVPAAMQAVFLIHVQVEPLAHALAAPERAARVHDALVSMSDAVLAYRGLVEVRAPLLQWLAQRSGR